MKKLVVVVILVILGIAGYFVAAKMKKSRVDPDVQRHWDAITAFLEDNRPGIEQLSERLGAVEALAAAEGWIPEGEKQAKLILDEPLLLWGFQLREQPLEGVDDSYTDYRELEPHLEWIETGDPGLAFMQGSVDRLQQSLHRADGAHWVVAEVESFVKPEITTLDLGSKDREIGEFSPGSTRFAIAIVDTETCEIVAHGRGQATSADEVEIKAVLDSLAADLWSRTESAAHELARQLAR